MEGWIKLHRKICKWEWWSDHNVSRLFLFLILNANHETGRWQGHDVNPGQLVTGRDSLSVDTGLTPQQIRTALFKLKSTNEITISATNKFSIITIVNWNEYQCDNQQVNQQITNNQPTNNQQITTNKNERMKEEDIKEKYKKEKTDLLFDLPPPAEEKLQQDRFAEFWSVFPKLRAGNPKKAHAAYLKAMKRATENEIIAGLMRYRDSDEVKRGFAKGAAAWLNDDRWTSSYAGIAPAPQNQNPNFRPSNPARNRKVIT